MKINRINRFENDSNLKAFCDIETDDGILIKNFKLVQGKNGLFLSPPSEKGKDGKYYDSVILPKEIKRRRTTKYSQENNIHGRESIPG